MTVDLGRAHCGHDRTVQLREDALCLRRAAHGGATAAMTGAMQIWREVIGGSMCVQNKNRSRVLPPGIQKTLGTASRAKSWSITHAGEA